MLALKTKKSEYLVPIKGGKPWQAMSCVRTFSKSIFGATSCLEMRIFVWGLAALLMKEERSSAEITSIS